MHLQDIGRNTAREVLPSFKNAILPLVLCIILAFSLVPFLPEAAIGAPEDAGLPKQTDAELESMLASGDYSEGEAIAIIDTTKQGLLSTLQDDGERTDASNAASLLEGAESLMDVSATTYLESQGIAEAAVESDPETFDLLSSASDDAISIRYVKAAGVSTRDLMYLLREDPRVLSVEPNYLYHVGEPAQTASASPEVLQPAQTNDLTPYQWGCENTIDTLVTKNKVEGFDIHAPLWDTQRTDPQEANAAGTIAVIDTGVDYNHPDLVNVVRNDMKSYVPYGGPHGYNAVEGSDPADPMDEFGHGTHCSGVIAAEWNGFGTSGVASGTTLVGVCAIDINGTLPMYAIIRGYQYLADAAEAGLDLRAINNSWGGSAAPNALGIAVTKLGELGAVSVFSSGNESTDIDSVLSECSTLQTNPYAVVVDAANLSAALAIYSNYGRATTDIVSQGSMVLSTVPLSLAQYYPEAVKEESGLNVVYESFENFDETNPTVSFENPSRNMAIGRITDQYYYDTHASFAIPTDDMDLTPDSPSGQGRFTMKIKTPPNRLDTVQYLGFRFYASTDNDDSDTYLFVRIAAKSLETGEPIWLNDVNYTTIHADGSDWGAASFDLADLCAQSNAELMLDNEGNLAVALTVLRADEQFQQNEVFCLDAIGLGVDGSTVPYDYYSGTSMATPMATGAAAVLSTFEEPKDKAEAAKLRAARLQGSVRPMPQFSDLCTSGGALDLSYALAGDYTPVIQTANVQTRDGSNIAEIKGYFFGEGPGTVTIGGFEAEVASWGDNAVKAICPAPLSTGVHEITVTNLGEHTGKKTLLLDMPAPPAPAATPLFEREFAFPQDEHGQTIGFEDGYIVGLGGSLYFLPTLNLLVEDSGRDLWRLDPAAGTWTKCADAPGPLVNITLTTYAGKLFVSGTNVSSGTPFQCLFSYDPQTNAWEEYASENIPAMAAVANFNGTILFLGGGPLDPTDHTVQPTPGVVSYDPTTGKTTPVGELSAPCCAPLSTAVYGDTLYVSARLYEGTSILALDSLKWSGGSLTSSDESARLPGLYAEQQNWLGIAPAKQGVVLSGSSGIPSDGDADLSRLAANGVVFDDQDTYLSDIAGQGSSAPFAAFGKRASYSQLFNVSVTSHRGLLYTFGSSNYEPGIFILRATSLETPNQPGDLFSISYHNADPSEYSNPAFYSDADLPLALKPAPDRAAAKFEGWYDNADYAGSPVTSLAVGTAGDVELWAKWETAPSPSPSPTPLPPTGDRNLWPVLFIVLAGASVLVLRAVRPPQSK